MLPADNWEVPLAAIAEDELESTSTGPVTLDLSSTARQGQGPGRRCRAQGTYTDWLGRMLKVGAGSLAAPCNRRRLPVKAASTVYLPGCVGAPGSGVPLALVPA